MPNRSIHTALGLNVVTDIDGSLSLVETVLETGLSIIVAVDSDDTRTWPYYHHHAVVVVGFTDDTVFVNNPAAQEVPEEVGAETFLWAWSQRDYEYAIISLTEGTESLE